MKARCIQLDMECAALCYAAAQAMSLAGVKIKDLCRLCAEACTAFAEECRKHKPHCYTR